MKICYICTISGATQHTLGAIGLLSSLDASVVFDFFSHYPILLLQPQEQKHFPMLSGKVKEGTKEDSSVLSPFSMEQGC